MQAYSYTEVEKLCAFAEFFFNSHQKSKTNDFHCGSLNNNNKKTHFCVKYCFETGAV